MGGIENQARELVCTYSSHMIYKVELDLSGLNVLSLPLNDAWSYVIAYNRGFLERKKDTEFYRVFSEYLNGYDVIIGKIADDKIYTSVNAFMRNGISDRVLFRSLSLMELGTQYVCKTHKACKNIKIISKYRMTADEMLQLRTKSLSRLRPYYRETRIW